VDELEIIKRIQKGETRLFSQIVGMYKNVVYGHAVSFLRNSQDAEDASQEIFVNIFNNIKRFRGDSKLGTWIYRITVNVCKNKLKQVQRLRSHIAEEHYEPGEEDEMGSLLAEIREKEEKEPDKIYASEQMRTIVFKRISELSDEQKQVIMLRDVDGLSYEEVADMMKLSVSAVKSKLFRARENLREKLEKDNVF
jgi:RNA polymerase sigma-70 factor (ECF subfamily)